MVTVTSPNRVEFRFFRPQAKQVFLVGDFNGWNRFHTPMQKKPNGEWTLSTDLRQGIHQFKYLADGDWFPDYAAFGLEPGPFGLNSVVVIEPASIPSQHQQSAA